ncbi:MAG: hypothetical protein K2I96_12860 [Lachnospiraceae bacterium]|nr:hypothetical protein [Lachnospiraceae bacterium]
MSSNTKIVVLRSKELVYALVLLVVSVLIIMVAVSLFLPAKDSASPAPTQNTEEPAEQVPSQLPSQTPSQTAPQTTPAGKSQNGSSNSTQSQTPGTTSNGTQNETSGTTPNGTSSGTQNGTSGGTSNGTQSQTSDSSQNSAPNSTSSTSTSSAQNRYVPGIYSSTLLLGNTNVELQIAVDKNHINSITLTNLDESVTTLYPLMSPTLSELAAVILSEQSIDNISYGSENRYTSMLLMQAITEALDKAAASENADRPESGVIY